ncbi:MAG: ATP-binding protein [Myxococcota bacterium]|nr:ATP-binding protein [Myxococcota bacterium]
MTASTRAAELCRQLLAYSGKGRSHIEEVALDTLVTEMIEVLAVNVAAHATIELVLATRGTAIVVDATQLRQIVMNLVINAAEALTTSARGTITITTSVEQLDADTIAATSQPDIAPGRYVALEVADDGPGMSADGRRRADLRSVLYDEGNRPRPRARRGRRHRPRAPRHDAGPHRARPRHVLQDLPAGGWPRNGGVAAGRRADLGGASDGRRGRR